MKAHTKWQSHRVTTRTTTTGITCGQRLTRLTAHCWSFRLRYGCWRYGYAMCLNALCIVTALAVVEVGGEVLYTEPHFQHERLGIVQLFEWRFSDVARECAEWLGPKGYAGVELSPITEHLLLEPADEDDATAAWSARYQPISYRIASNLGNKEDFHTMTQACNAAGVRIYVAVVLNHMAAPYDTYTSRQYGGNIDLSSDMLGSADGIGNAGTHTYSDFKVEDFNAACNGSHVERYGSAMQLRNCAFDLRPDLNQSRIEVRNTMQTFLNELIALGVAGFRVHAAEHMWPEDLKKIFDGINNLNSADFDLPENGRPFIYMDVNDVEYRDLVSRAEYVHIGLVLEHNYPQILNQVLWQDDLRTLFNTGPGVGYVQHGQAAVFVDTPLLQRKENQSSNQLLTFRQRQRFVLATAFMLAHPYGRVKLLMSSYHFDQNRLAQGAPSETPIYDEQQQCEGKWVCEHRWPPITALIELVKSLDPQEDSILNMQSFGSKQIAFGRGHKAFFAFNKDLTREYIALVHTGLPVGVYCDVITGGRSEDGKSCVGQQLVVQEDGSAELKVPALHDNEDDLNDIYSVLAVHLDSMLELEVTKIMEKQGSEEEILLETEQQDELKTDGSEEVSNGQEAIEKKELEAEEEQKTEVPEGNSIAQEAIEGENNSDLPEPVAGDIDY